MRLAATLAALAFSLPAFAAPPNACEVLTMDDVSTVSERPVVKTRTQKAGNPSECAFLDSRNAVVMVLSLKEVQYAVKDELGVERSNLEKVYKVRAKYNETVGDEAFWIGANKSFWFRKGKVIGSVTFQTPKNQTELDTAQMARLAESRIK